MAANPDPARITDALWYLWERLHDLEPDTQLGGIYANKPGYHNTRAANSKSNYSVVDAEDKGGPSDKAAAIDWTFPEAHSASYDRIDRYSSRLLASGQDPGDHRLDGWREFYGQCDADTHVEGYDFRYSRTGTSDPSHLWHIHLSCDRDKVTSFENMDKLLSVLRGEPVSETYPAKGDKGEGVKQLQYDLEDLGYDTGEKDGVYDDAVVKAVDKFRRDHSGGKNTGGDKVTGWTRHALNRALAKLDAGAAGPKGDPGEPGPPGEKGDAAVLAPGSTLTVTG
jgi:hypothetical protein